MSELQALGDGSKRIESKYATPEPDFQVQLYEGILVTNLKGEQIQGAGSISLRWLPSPGLQFQVEVDPDIPLATTWSLFDGPEHDIELTTSDHNGKGKGSAWGSSHLKEDGKPLQRTLHGFVDDFTLGNPAPVSLVRFEVPNFPKFYGHNVGIEKEGGAVTWATRMVVETSEWRVKLESKRRAEPILDQLAKQGGYGLTHVGEVERVDGKAIHFAEVERLWHDLSWWLSMLRSERTGPVILLGVHDGGIVWEYWKVPAIEEGGVRLTWLPLQAASPQDGSFPGGAAVFNYLRKLNPSSDERRVVARAIDWYTQSVQSINDDPTVIMAQAGLELLSWLRLTEVGLSEDGFRELNAADRLRLALNYAAIPLEVPKLAEHLHGATRATAEHPLELDGPGAITQMRNALVHPRPSSRLSDPTVIFEGGRLATRYLELLLLNRFGYIGETLNRIDWLKGKLELVPWAPES